MRKLNESYEAEKSTWTVESLKAFESNIADMFNSGKIKAPVHLSDGNERNLLEIFKDFRDGDWTFC